MRKIFILHGNPHRGKSLTGALADVYESAAREVGYAVERLNLSEMQFDPILHNGYREIQPLEPDVMRFQQMVRECDHLVLIYPNWWCTMPALLKGLFDRAWLPGFAFNMRKGNDGAPVAGWHKLLKGKTARVIITAGSRPFLIRLVFGDFTNEIKYGILWFAGFKPKITTFGPADHASARTAGRWMKKVQTLGRRGL